MRGRRAVQVAVAGGLALTMAACGSGDPADAPIETAVPGPSTDAPSSAPTPVGPGARSVPELVYDYGRAQVLMINGEAGGNSTDAGRSAVLWAFDGARWTKIAEDGPPGRSLGGVAYDSSRERLVVAGGLVGDTAVSDTWEWNGIDWADRGAPIPDGVSNHLAAVYDAARSETVIVFGQHADLSLSTATLGWDGSQWIELADGGPPARAHYALGYDPEREVVVLFGGYDGADLGDTWEWHQEQWTRVG